MLGPCCFLICMPTLDHDHDDYDHVYHCVKLYRTVKHPWKQMGPLKMSSQVRKVRGEKSFLKSKGTESKASHDLRRLLFLLAKPAPRHEVNHCKLAAHHNKPRGSGAKSHGSLHHHHHDVSMSKTESNTGSEMSELDKFSTTYRNQRHFNSHPLHKLFTDLLTSLIKNRLCSEWIDHASPEHVLRVLICLRLLIRDPLYQIHFHEVQGVNLLARYMDSVTATYLQCGEQPFAMQKLDTMTCMFQKLSTLEEQRAWVIESGAHRTLVKLLSTKDSSVLLGALLALTTLAESSQYKERIGELPIVEHLLVILQEYDLLSKRVSAELLRLLSPVSQVREQVRDLEGVPVLLSLLHGQHLKLLWSVAWVLVQLSEEPDSRTEIRTWGGVQQLLRLLNSDRQYVSDCSSIETLASANAAGRIQKEHIRDELSPQENMDNTMAMKSACCTALTELVLDDTAAHNVVQENGIHIVAKLILPYSQQAKATALQCYAFRTLRFLFSVERNRHLFKRLFPTDLFELFIDIGHYVRDLTAYEVLQNKVSLYSEEELDSLRDNIEAVDQNRPPLRVINGYSILDHLGTGAFGSVFKVRKQSGQNLLALKEVNLHNPAFGKDKKSRDNNVERIVSELTIIKEQMTHPNIVKYYRTFVEGDRLYIVMELIEGVTLADHFNSLKEKQQTFTEERIWNIFIQMCLALRYLHKEKRIVHRDLTPNNVMLGEKDKVTITDFGLAKQKQENSKLTSVVGTILYSCPEVVKSEPYGEKADIWAAGCILYQMATLQPPFYSNNMLSLATKIVEAVYEPVAEGTFSERVTDMIQWCLNPDADLRPDIVAVSSRMADIMMRLMDGLYTSHHALEKRAERDRKRAQKYFLERHKYGASLVSGDSRVPEVPQDQEKTTMQTEPLPLLPSSACSSIHSELSQDDASDDDTGSSKIKDNAAAPMKKHDRSAKSHSSVTLDQSLTEGDYAAANSKPRPVSAGIYVSHKMLRQIEDPIQRLLVQLHKILYITQLPPAPHHNIKRRVIERFKKSLFHHGSSPFNLKVELSKLVQGSAELVELGSGCSDWWPLIHSFTGDHHAVEGPDVTDVGNLKDGITFEQLQGIIEEVLEENEYYKATYTRNDQEKSCHGSGIKK